MDFNTVILAYVPVIAGFIGIYFHLKGDVQSQEKRMTVIEEGQKHLKEQIELNVKRLDNHDEQNRVLIALTEQVKALSEDIKRVEKKLEKGL